MTSAADPGSGGIAQPAKGAPGIAVEAVLDAGEAALRRTARRYSLCSDDAEDAYQRAVEILLTKAPDRPPSQLAAWMQVVTRREALAVRRSRERLLAVAGDDDPLQRIACERPGPADRAERRERVALAARALATLKPDERLAIVLYALGYSYAEIGELRGWTHTKLERQPWRAFLALLLLARRSSAPN